MERQFHNEEFERLLRDNANQYRMYPSEKVWKGIYSTLHTRRKWYGISALAMLLITGTLITVFVLNNNTETKGIAERKNIPGSVLRQPQAVNNVIAGSGSKTISNPLVSIAENAKIISGDEAFEPVFEMNHYPAAIEISSAETQIPGLIKPSIAFNLSESRQPEKNDNGTGQKELTPLTEKIETVIPAEKVSGKEDTKTLQDAENEKKINRDVMAIASNKAPVKTTKKTARLTAQVYFTPSISYRKLSENKSYSSAQPFNFSQLTDVNNVVNHKPALGFEFGMEGHYRINNRFSFKSGLQFNINRYDIRAYSHPTEIATIALNSGFPRDSVSALSNYRNFSGYSSNWLENFYFQVALPVGAELILADNKKVRWGVAGTIQPTYVIGDRAYLISSDYKNYAKVPNLMRRWNLNTSFETFVAYSTGRIGWQVGPQVRYQHLSSFVSKYPVKENLFDVGLKVGAKLNKKK